MQLEVARQAALLPHRAAHAPDEGRTARHGHLGDAQHDLLMGRLAAARLECGEKGVRDALGGEAPVGRSHEFLRGNVLF